MADKRKFAKSIIMSDLFVEMPLSSQALYFHLSMEADDEGFLNSPQRVRKSIGASNEDMTCLEEQGFIYRFESGVIVIMDWHINNQIRSDRRHRFRVARDRQDLSRLAGGGV